MPTEILMPELGESVHEGTVSRWLKAVGDAVKEDEPIVEIMTDKVNTELPSPAAGILTQILIKEGDPVKVFEAMGVISAANEAGAAPESGVRDPESGKAPATLAAAPTIEAAPDSRTPDSESRRFFTPVVKAMIRENAISEAQIATIRGSGEAGRVTKRDVEAFLATPQTTPQAPEPASVAKVEAPKIEAPKVEAPRAEVKPTQAGPDQEIVPLAGMRKMIADHMVRSSQVPVVTTITACDVTKLVAFRDLNKDAFLAANGVKLTYTPFFIKALTETLVEFPLVNSSLQPDNTILKNNAVHMGVAVALGKDGSGGLIVPVIKDAHKKSLVEIARDLDGIAKRARSNALAATEVQGGTFTLTNPGTYGALFGTPMINAPQGAILGTYAIEKRPVIVDDMIAIRSIMHLVLTYDHRIIDGMLAGRFLAGVRDRLQNFDFYK